MAELEPPPSSYSIDTLAKLARRFGATGKDFYFIAGADSLLDVTGWRDSETLLMSYNFIFVVRPGVEVPDIHAALPRGAASRIVDCRSMDSTRVGRRIAAELEGPECRIFVVDLNAPDVAASKIRRLAGSGQSIDDLVPVRVREYIVKLHLYGD
jgi:nicotinate (nicotinamide) nucleotide adenylyltransferase